LLVDDVVDALTSLPEGVEGTANELREQMQRAAEEFDRRTAEAFARALVDSLCEDPGDVRRLEALLILGLAHPPILEKYQVSLAAEGRRLCVLLENQGDVERARSLLEVLATRLPDERELQQDLASFMRRAGDVDQLVERCLQRADEEVRKGRPMEAISWLQEILLHDQSRRDVARMIRDLRYQEMENLARRKRRNRLVLLLMVVTTTLTAMVLRERNINEQYAALPPFTVQDGSSLSARLDGLDHLIAGNRLWLGMFDVVGERSELQKQRDRISARQAEAGRKELELQYQRTAQAEALRLSAIAKVAAGELEAALAEFELALESSSPDWPRRERVEANIEAIQELLEQRN
jgi:tetratricopeptide (TPR) repeat protein